VPTIKTISKTNWHEKSLRFVSLEQKGNEMLSREVTSPNLGYAPIQKTKQTNQTFLIHETVRYRHSSAHRAKGCGPGPTRENQT
jgi:hypothetical protein